MNINFLEIHDDHAFENFCMHLLERMGLSIDISPAVGRDGGRDIICKEPSLFGNFGFRWLVSCKHRTTNKKSIGINDDSAKANKLIEHGCHGFFFFFSKPFTEDFRDSVDRVCNNTNSKYKILNCYDIERILLSSPRFYPLIKQYFPASHDRLISLTKKDFCCSYCNPDNYMYAVYHKAENHEVHYQILCDSCLDYLLESFYENGTEYGYCQIENPLRW